ncbi:MAG: hypothetical protein ACLPYW_09130 [Acidimicrobiales bacterium]
MGTAVGPVGAAGSTVHSHSLSLGHPHPHPHLHPHSALAEAHPPTEPSTGVCIDVGGTMGALLLRSVPEREGLEVEIHPVDKPDAHTHVWVLPRATGAAVTYAALFPSLPAGRYQVLEPDGSCGPEVLVEAGRVTTADWR